MESTTDQELRRAEMIRRTGVDPSASFGQRLKQQIPQTVMSILNALNAVRPGVGPSAITGGARRVNDSHDLWANHPIRPATRSQGEFFSQETGPNFYPTRFRVRSNNPEIEAHTPRNNTVTIPRPSNENAPRVDSEAYSAALESQQPQRRFSTIPGGREPGNITKGGNNPPIAPEEVTAWLEQAQIPIRRTNTTEEGTTYIRMNSDRERTRSPTIRIPSDGHLGTARDNEIGNLFDTGSHWTHRPPPRDRETSRMVSRNVSGGRYSDPNNLFDALRWRFSRSPDGQFLIPPDQAPVGVYRANPPEPTPRPSPNQLDLFNEYMMKVLGRDNGPR